MKIKNKLYIKVIAVLFLFLSLGLFLYSCKKVDKKVLFNLNGGNVSGNTNSVEVLVKHGEKLSAEQIPKPVKEKNRLAGWLLDGALFNSEAEKIEKDITLTAKWIEQVSLSLPNDVKAEGIKDLNSIDKDTNVTLEHIVQAGKTLKSFKINGEEKKSELVANKITFKITQDTKVEIEYETSVVEENYSLTLPAEVKANVADLTKIKKGTDVELEFIPQAGKTLKSFKINGEEKKDKLVANKLTFKITQNTTVEVELENNPIVNYFSLTLPAEVKANVANLAKIAENTDVELEFIPQVGKTLKSFKINGEEKKGELVANKITFKITKNTTVEVELENATNPLKAELDAEKAKVDALVQNGKIELSDDVTLENVKAKIEEVVDTDKVSVEVVEKEAGKKYEIKLTHKKDVTLTAVNEYEFEKAEDLTQFLTEIDEELEKIDNALVSNLLEIELEQSQNITVEKVKERLNNIVDNSVVNVNVTEVEAGKKYNVELVHKDNEKAKKDKTYEVKKILPKFGLTFDSNFIEIVEPAAANPDSITQGTRVKIRIKTPEHKDLKTLSKNNIPVPMSEINNNEYEFEMTGNITLKVEFKVKQEYIQKLEEEFNKLSDVRVVAPDGNVQVEKVKEKLEELLDMSIVAKVEVVKKDENKFEITLTHKLSGEATFTKDLTVLPEVVKVTLDLQGKATYKGMDKPVITVYKKSKLTEDKLPKASELTYINSQDVFKSWTTDKDGNTPFPFNKIMDYDETIYAQYSAGAHTVKFNIVEDILNKSNYDGFTARVLNEQTLEYPFSEEIILPGYKLLKWINKDTNDEFKFGVTKVEQNIEIKPVFDTETYLEFEKVEEGSTNARITGVKPGIAHLYIPETLTVSGVKYTIVAIGEQAFEFNQTIKSLTILGNKLEEIHCGAFYLSKLEKVKLPQSVKVVSDFAFAETSIEEIVIPASLKSIGHNAFAAKTLRKVVFEDSDFTNINKNQFANSEWLKKGVENDDHVLVVNGVLLAADGAFTKDMIIPNNVKKIGEWAFSEYDCSNITFGKDIEEISSYAFFKSKLGNRELTLPKSVKYIGFRAFAGTLFSKITKFSFEEGSKLEYIRAEAFYNTGIKEIVLPEGLKEIGDKVFSFSTSLKKITIPTSLTRFGFGAFDDTAWYNDRLNEGHFIVANDTLLDASKMTAADKIPNVKRIAKGAFINLKNIEELEIPESVEYIDSYAFYLNGDLKKVKIPGTIKKIEKRGFIFETYYTGGNKDPIHLDVMVSEVESAPTTWNNDWNQIREHESRKAGLYTFHWAYKNKVTFDLDGGNVSDEIKAQVLNKGEMASEPSVVPTKPGKVFVGWFLDDSVYDFTKPVVKSITLKAKYADVNPDYDLAYENNELVFVRLKNNTLKEFAIPENVEGAQIKRIKKDAFKDNITIEKVVIPDSVKAIEDDAFNGDTNLGDITFGTGVKEFGKDFIKGTKWLSQKQTSDKAVVINKVLVDAKNLEENAELPADIEKISKYAFAENTTTKILIIKEGVVEIEGNAFKGNTQIEKITLPSTMMLARKDAFAMGRAGNVEIDAKLVSHQKPKTWEDGYDNGDGATLVFKWKQVTTYKINLIDGITLTDPTLFPDSIVSGSNVEIAVAQKQYHAVSKFTVNGVNRLDDLKAGNYKLTINVTSDVTFELEYDLEGEIKDEFMNEFNKLQDKMGYVHEDNEINDITAHISNFTNGEIVEVSVERKADKYDVTLKSKKVPTYSKTKENVEIVRVSKVGAGAFTGSDASAYVNYNESPEKAFDGRNNTKWCDNSSAEKWIEGILSSEMFIAQINIVHAEMGGESASMNTKKFTIQYAGSDGVWKDWQVVDDNRSSYSKHSFAGAPVKRIRVKIAQAEQASNSAARIYEIEAYAQTETVRGTLKLNGGLINGSHDDVVKDIPKGVPLLKNMFPTPTKDHYRLKTWLIKSTNQEIAWGATILTQDEELEAVWEKDPASMKMIQDYLDMVKPVEFVIKDSEEMLTTDEIKDYIEAEYNFDESKVKTLVQQIAGDKYRVTISILYVDGFEVSKEIEVIKKKTDEKSEVRFDLNGGTYNGSADDVVMQHEKGTKLTEDIVLDEFYLKKDNFVFDGWLIDGQKVDPVGYLVKGNTKFTANWAPKPASGSRMNGLIKDLKILQGRPSWKDEFAIGKCYDSLDTGEANLNTRALVQYDWTTGKVELLFEFKHNVEIDKIVMHFLGSAPNSNNMTKLHFYGSTIEEFTESDLIGVAENNEHKFKYEMETTNKKTVRFVKVVIDKKEQKKATWSVYLADISFIAK